MGELWGHPLPLSAILGDPKLHKEREKSHDISRMRHVLGLNSDPFSRNPCKSCYNFTFSQDKIGTWDLEQNIFRRQVYFLFMGNCKI